MDQLRSIFQCNHGFKNVRNFSLRNHLHRVQIFVSAFLLRLRYLRLDFITIRFFRYKVSNRGYLLKGRWMFFSHYFDCFFREIYFMTFKFSKIKINWQRRVWSTQGMPRLAIVFLVETRGRILWPKPDPNPKKCPELFFCAPDLQSCPRKYFIWRHQGMFLGYKRGKFEKTSKNQLKNW
jgi:hypothetical protein